MHLLALETATHRLSVALWLDGRRHRDGRRIAQRQFRMAAAHRPCPAGRGRQSACSRSMASPSAPARAASPGLRLAAGCAQGLAFGLDLPVLGIGTLEALALASGEDKAFACLDARMNEVYTSPPTQAGARLWRPSVTPPAQVPMPAGEGWIGCGDGFAQLSAIDCRVFRACASGLSADGRGGGATGGAAFRARRGRRCSRGGAALCARQGGADDGRAAGARRGALNERGAEAASGIRADARSAMSMP